MQVKINIMTSILKNNIRVEDILKDIFYITTIAECHGEFISVQRVPSRTVYSLSLNNVEKYITASSQSAAAVGAAY